MKGRKANKSSWGLPRPCPNCDKKFLRASKWQKYCVSCRDKKWIMRSNKGGSRPKSYIVALSGLMNKSSKVLYTT